MEAPKDIASPKLVMHKDSRVISKFKPKVRIIHIFAPEIIKTEVENFRELVQRLTGKPTNRRGPKTKKKHPTRNMIGDSSFIQESSKVMLDEVPNMLSTGECIKFKEKGHDDQRWEAGSSNGLFDGFSTDLDGFIQELRDGGYPIRSSHMDHTFQL